MVLAQRLFRAGRRVAVMGLVVGVAGCAPLPDIAPPSRGAPASTPVLVPLDGILAQADAVGAGEAAVGSVSSRAARLRDRANRLRRQ